MKFSWSVWLKGLAAAAIGGAAAGAAQASTSGTSLKGTGLTAGAGGITTVLAYLLQSPLFKANVAVASTPAIVGGTNPEATAPKA